MWGLAHVRLSFLLYVFIPKEYMNIFSECIFSLFLTVLSFKKEVQPLHMIQPWSNPAKETSLLEKGSWGVCSCKNLIQEGRIVRSLWIGQQTWGFWVCEYVLVRWKSVKCHRIKQWHSTASSVPLAVSSSMLRELGEGKLFPNVAEIITYRSAQ